MDQKTEPSTDSQDVTHFDQWAATYEQSIGQIFFFRPVQAKMLKLLEQKGPKEPPKCIVDVGCGTGRLLRMMAVHWPKAQLIGVDPSEQMLKEARLLNPIAEFKPGFAESLPLADESADIVLSSLSFHHWANHKKGVQEIARVLRPGGFFCLADHEMTLAKLFGEKVKSRNEIQAFMTDAGLTVRQHRGVGWRFVLITLAEKL